MKVPGFPASLNNQPISPCLRTLCGGHSLWVGGAAAGLLPASPTPLPGLALLPVGLCPPPHPPGTEGSDSLNEMQCVRKSSESLSICDRLGCSCSYLVLTETPQEEQRKHLLSPL